MKATRSDNNKASYHHGDLRHCLLSVAQQLLKQQGIPILEVFGRAGGSVAQVTWSSLHGLAQLVIDGIYVEGSAIDEICDCAGYMMSR